MIKSSDLENAYALVIGISNYKDPRIPKLNYTRADAEGIFKLLTDPEKMGLNQDKIKFLLEDDATLFNIKNAISDWLFKNADKDSVVFIYFAGHGGVEEDRLGIEKDKLGKYLLPFDSVFDNLFASALSNRDFNELLLTIKSKKLVIFMDSCYSGGVSDSKARNVKITEDPYQKLGVGEGRIVIAASQADQRSFEDATIGHGVFTYNLLEALSGKADLDGDGYVTVLEVYRYLEDAVPRTAMKLAGGMQEPIFRGDVKKDFVISVNRGRLKEIAKEKTIQEKLQKLGNLYDSDKLPGQYYEKLKRLLKTDLKELTDNERKIVKRINDLLDGNISLSTFIEDLERIEGEPEKLVEKLRNGEKEIDENGIKKYCIKCGNPNERMLKFCTKCGISLL